MIKNSGFLSRDPTSRPPLAITPCRFAPWAKRIWATQKTQSFHPAHTSRALTSTATSKIPSSKMLEGFQRVCMSILQSRDQMLCYSSDSCGKFIVCFPTFKVLGLVTPCPRTHRLINFAPLMLLHLTSILD